MKRLNLIKNHLSNKKTYVDSAYDYFYFDDFLSKDDIEYRKRVRKFLETQVSPKIEWYLEKQEFPLELMRSLVKKFPGILGLKLKGFGSAGLSFWLAYALILEFARCDLSLATFVLISGGELIMNTIQTLGSVAQKEKYLPKLNTLDMVGSFCLTEPDYGSDASSLEALLTENSEGNYILEGQKTWIGNATIADFLIVWARNLKTNKINGIIVETSRQGIEIQKIEGKSSVRAMQNCHIKFVKVVLPKENIIPGAHNFGSGPSNMMLVSRIGVAWAAVGACIGAYDKVIEFISTRRQFGKPISSFQLIQSKLSTIMANIQSMLFLAKRTAELLKENKITLGRVGLCKSWCTQKARETLSIARDMMGGKGILYENGVIRKLLDLEAIHTYEGTYDINVLINSRELTGKSAFK